MSPSEPARRKQQEALRDLDGLRRERDVFQQFWRSLFASDPMARGTRNVATAAEDPSDPIEYWGRRIGRTLGAVAFLALCAYLFLYHVR